MLTKNEAALDFLLSRRSRPAKTLTAPGPDKATLETILTAAARTPDHGKLEPWRFVVLNETAMRRIGQEIRAFGEKIGKDEADIEKAAFVYDKVPSAVVVIESQKPSEKIPAIEQTYSAGAVCLALLNAALASGVGANWLSGWASHQAPEIFGANEGELIAGIIHLGTETSVPPDRPRPDLTAITTWLEA